MNTVIGAAATFENLDVATSLAEHLVNAPGLGYVEDRGGASLTSLEEGQNAGVNTVLGAAATRESGRCNRLGRAPGERTWLGLRRGLGGVSLTSLEEGQSGLKRARREPGP